VWDDNSDRCIFGGVTTDAERDNAAGCFDTVAATSTGSDGSEESCSCGGAAAGAIFVTLFIVAIAVAIAYVVWTRYLEQGTKDKWSSYLPTWCPTPCTTTSPTIYTGRAMENVAYNPAVSGTTDPVYNEVDSAPQTASKVLHLAPEDHTNC